MNSDADAIEALARIPGWDPRECRIENMDGGLMNRVYRVRSNGRECALRIDTESGGIVGPDRRCELKIMEAAGKAGIAPAVLYANAEAGILMTEYLHGTVWQESDLEADENLEALAKLLRRVHALPLCGSEIDLELFAKRYADYLKSRNSLTDFALHCVEIIRGHAPPEHLACCHNDVVATNVIDSGSLHLIDWEYACDNEPLYDLASLIGFHDLEKSRQDMLLSAYAGGTDGELRERLAGQVRLFDAVQWLWLAMRQVASPRNEQSRRLEELNRRIR